jgi:hypothetical protein
MSDLVIFAGPVVVSNAFKQVPWRRPTTVVAIPGTGSDFFHNIAMSVKTQDGRVLPGLVRKYTGKDLDAWDNIALASFSAGWGLLNEVAKHPLDQDRIVGMTMHDSAFGSNLEGFPKLAQRAATAGDKVMVFTNTNNSANWAMGIKKTARETMVDIAHAVQKVAPLQLVEPAANLPVPSGGVYNAGSFYWYDYVKPGAPANTGNDYWDCNLGESACNSQAHSAHHYLAPRIWTAYLVPALAGESLSSSGMSSMLSSAAGSIVSAAKWLAIPAALVAAYWWSKKRR